MNDTDVTTKASDAVNTGDAGLPPALKNMMVGGVPLVQLLTRKPEARGALDREDAETQKRYDDLFVRSAEKIIEMVNTAQTEANQAMQQDDLGVFMTKMVELENVDTATKILGLMMIELLPKVSAEVKARYAICLCGKVRSAGSFVCDPVR